MWHVTILFFFSYVEMTFMSSTKDQKIAIDQAMRTLFEHPHPLCPGCGDHKSDGVDTELTALRVEFVKQQILKKLKLKEVPKVTFPHNKLPIPILTKRMYQNTVQKRIEDSDFQGEDDFFGKTNQVILFPEGKTSTNSYRKKYNDTTTEVIRAMIVDKVLCCSVT